MKSSFGPKGLSSLSHPSSPGCFSVSSATSMMCLTIVITYLLLSGTVSANYRATFTEMAMPEQLFLLGALLLLYGFVVATA